MAPLARSHMLRVRMSDDEMQKLREIAEAEGLSASDMVRLYIRREHKARFPDRPLKGTAAKGKATKKGGPHA